MILTDEEIEGIVRKHRLECEPCDYSFVNEGAIAQLKKVFIEIDKVYNSEDPQLALAYLHKALSEEVKRWMGL